MHYNFCTRKLLTKMFSITIIPTEEMSIYCIICLSLFLNHNDLCYQVNNIMVKRRVWINSGYIIIIIIWFMWFTHVLQKKIGKAYNWNYKCCKVHETVGRIIIPSLQLRFEKILFFMAHPSHRFQYYTAALIYSTFEKDYYLADVCLLKTK